MPLGTDQKADRRTDVGATWRALGRGLVPNDAVLVLREFRHRGSDAIREAAQGGE